MSDVFLKLYHESEEEILLKLWHATWQKTYADIDFNARLPGFTLRWREKIVPHAHIVVAYRSGNMIGFYTLDHSSMDMDQFLVGRGAQGSGVAHILMEDAKRCSPAGIDLKVNADNHRAIAFYDKEGFIADFAEFNERRALVWNMKWRPDRISSLRF